MDHLDQAYFMRRAREERDRARQNSNTSAATFYHKLADAYEREATRIPASGADVRRTFISD